MNPLFERLEPCTVKVVCTVLRGRGDSNVTSLPDWTSSLWGKDWEKSDFKYPYKTDDKKREDLHAGDDVMRVLRGGSFDLAQVNARAAYRHRYPPDYRSDHVGFRVCVRSAPVSSTVRSEKSGL